MELSKIRHDVASGRLARPLRGTSFCLMLLATLLVGCAEHTLRAARRTADVARARSLQRIESAEQLRAAVAINAEYFDQAEQIRTRLGCAQRMPPVHLQCGESDESSVLDQMVVTGTRIRETDVITNNQEQGVDEGDIVKKLGDRLFVLRHGKLHTISLVVRGAEELRLVDTLVVATDGSEETTWYDEILAIDGRLILLGFNWDEEVAELSMFDVDSEGRLAHRARYWIGAEDYFSESNYGARIQGDNLLLSLSLTLAGSSNGSLNRSGRISWPQWSRRDEVSPQWTPLLEPTDVYAPMVVSEYPYLHVILSCPITAIAGGMFDCKAAGVIGSRNTEFYASANAAYLSIAEWESEVYLDPAFEELEVRWGSALRHFWRDRYTMVYRLPFDAASSLEVAKVDGVTGDQFSFVERDGSLYVVTSQPGGPQMSELDLHRIPLASFGDELGAGSATIAHIEVLEAYQTFRFSGAALWIGAGWMDSDEVPVADLLRQPLDGGALQQIPLTHSADMIEPLGEQLLVSGVDADDRWALSAVVDRDGAATPAAELMLPAHFPSESRSHAFNAARRGSGWLFGLPVVGRDVDDSWDNPSDLALFSLDAGMLRQQGIVDMQHETRCAADYNCDEWYGDARVFFVGERVFGMSGELLRELRVGADDVSVLRTVTLE